MVTAAGRPAPRSETDDPLVRASSAASVALLLGSADSPVPVVQNTRASRIAPRSSSSRAMVMSGACGSR